MVVRDCMTAPVLTAHPEETVAAVREVFRRRRIRQLPVVAAGRLIGIVTDRDVRSAASDAATVDDVMTPNPVTTTPATPVERAATTMRERKVGALPVVECETLVGIVSESDLLEALTRLCAVLDPTTAIELECEDDPNAPTRIRRVLERHGGQIAWLTAARSHGGRQRISFRTRMPMGAAPEKLLEEAGFPVSSCIMSSSSSSTR